MKKIERDFLFVMVGIGIAEFILNLFPEAGFFIYAIFVGIVLVMMENEVQHTKEEKVFIFLMILPICRLAEIFFNFNFFWNTLIFYLLIISLVIYYSIKFWYRIRKSTFIGNPIYLFIVLFLSIVAWALAKYAFQVDFANIIFLIPIIVYAEEILFRGGIQNLTNEWFGNVSILFTAFIYAMFSISYGFVFVLIAFGASLVINTTYHITKNLYLTYILNIIFHVLLLMFYPVVFGM